MSHPVARPGRAHLCFFSIEVRTRKADILFCFCGLCVSPCLLITRLRLARCAMVSILFCTRNI